MLLSIAGAQLASANMFSHATMDTFGLGFNYSASKTNSMHLGQWKYIISAKLMPSYFDDLSTDSNSFETLSVLNLNSKINKTRLITRLFSTDSFTDFSNDKVLSFSFISKVGELNQTAINANFYNSNKSFANKSSKISPVAILEQEYYSPGYTLSTGKNAFSINAIFIQQKFSDNSISTSSSQNIYQKQLYLDDHFYNVNRGTGYSINFKREFISDLYLTAAYNSKVRMNEFGSFGQSYSDFGNFDIPQKFLLSLGVPLIGNNKIEFSAENVSYSQIDINSRTGYSYYFLNHVRTFFRPDQVSLDDLTVYSVKFEQNLNGNFIWNIDISSTQQASTSSSIYNNALDKDTAAYSYKVGLYQNTSIGQFHLFASFANKPILVGSTDFGRFTNTSLGQHIEGVASWNFAF